MTNKKDNPDKYRQHKVGLDQFEARFYSQHFWQMNARRLFISATILLNKCWEAKDETKKLVEKKKELKVGTPEHLVYETTQLYLEASMLLAFSLENYLKALWIRQNYDDAQGLNAIPKEIKEHNLVDLATITGIELAITERQALEILSLHSVWRGRYTIPKTKNKFAEYWSSDIDRGFVLKKYPSECDWPDEIHSLLKKIKSKLAEIPEGKRC